VTTVEPWEQEVPVELAPVRAGEELAWDRLEAYLRRVLAIPEAAPAMTVLQFPNGSANLTYLLTFGDRRVVLRRPPFGEIAPGAHDMTREYRVLSRLWQQYDRAPRAFVLGEDRDVIDADFVVSEYRQGEVIWASLPPSMSGLPDAAERIGMATVDALADLHVADPHACGLGDLGRPDGFVERQLAGWRKRWGLVATDDHAGKMDAVADELARQRPQSPPPTLLHNDFKLDNCQFTPGQPDRVTAVFDWDMATLGDPFVDFGTLLNYWPDPSDTADDRALHVPGMERLGLPRRTVVVARYAERTGFDVGDVHWYEAFACWRVAIICQQLYQRYVRGESTDERMASRGDNVGMLANRARRILAEKGQC
jgi:aminoglycoside phosphotransferase (APT) family kinase protein